MPACLSHCQLDIALPVRSHDLPDRGCMSKRQTTRGLQDMPNSATATGRASITWVEYQHTHHLRGRKSCQMEKSLRCRRVCGVGAAGEPLAHHRLQHQRLPRQDPALPSAHASCMAGALSDQLMSVAPAVWDHLLDLAAAPGHKPGLQL